MDVLSELERLHETASRGPWVSDVTDEGELVVHAGGEHVMFAGVDMETSCATCHADMDITAAMRNALPMLLRVAYAADALVTNSIYISGVVRREDYEVLVTAITDLKATQETS